MVTRRTDPGGCTRVLMLASRQATLCQTQASLAEISAQLKRLTREA